MTYPAICRQSNFTVIGIVVLCLVIASQGQCGDQSGARPDPAVTTESAPNQQQVLVESINRFGFKLFGEMAASVPLDSNIFISPISAASILAIAYNGASGVTRKEIATCLELSSLSLNKLNLSWHNLIDEISTNDSFVEFSLANSIWTRIGKTLEPSFTEALSSYYCHIEQIDFQQQSGVNSINEWISRATGNRISRFAKESIPSDAAAILLNGAYYKGAWKRPFDRSKTHLTKFYLAGGGEVDCQMMLLTREDFASGSSGRPILDPDIKCYLPDILGLRNDETTLRKVAGVTLPYGTGHFRMTVLVPFLYYIDSSATIDTLLDQLTYETWRTTLRLSTNDHFDLWLPKFTIDYSVSLREMLVALGMKTAFDPHHANFSHMFTDGIGWIDRVEHKTFVQVDETGTEAAAVTEFLFPDSIPPEIRADRPFVVIIHEESTGVILFIGKIANPTFDRDS